MQDRLGAVDLRDDAHFYDYGLSDGDIEELRVWATLWAEDLRPRAAAEEAAIGAPDDQPDWDNYLEP